jgi:riboflavin biosynthesis pyrimidine reductase
VRVVSTASRERCLALAPYATIVVQDGPTVELTAALQYLTEHFGVKTLLSEGGPRLNQALLDAGLVDELFWTVAPKLAGGHGRTLFDGDMPARLIRTRLELVSLFEQHGELYTRYRLPRGADGAYLTPR